MGQVQVNFNSFLQCTSIDLKIGGLFNLTDNIFSGSGSHMCNYLRKCDVKIKALTSSAFIIQTRLIKIKLVYCCGGCYCAPGVGKVGGFWWGNNNVGIDDHVDGIIKGVCGSIIIVNGKCDDVAQSTIAACST